MEIVKKPRDLWNILYDMEQPLADLNQTRNLSEIMGEKFNKLDPTDNEKLWTYHEFETLMPILHERIHNTEKQLKELFQELWEAMKVKCSHKQAA